MAKDSIRDILAAFHNSTMDNAAIAKARAALRKHSSNEDAITSWLTHVASEVGDVGAFQRIIASGRAVA